MISLISFISQMVVHDVVLDAVHPPDYIGTAETRDEYWSTLDQADTISGTLGYGVGAVALVGCGAIICLANRRLKTRELRS
jgi:hypothetical protein